MDRIICILAGCALMVFGRAHAASLAELFSGPAPAELTADSIKGHFTPSIQVENFSRDRCFPVLKATPTSDLHLAGSFIGTTLHQPCLEPQRVVIMKFQVRSATSSEDARLLGDQLSALNGPPCFRDDAAGHFAIFWSDKSRVLGVSDGIDQGSGYTVTLFSRAALTPAKDEADEQAYKLWDGSAPGHARRTGTSRCKMLMGERYVYTVSARWDRGFHPRYTC